jgi:hypothetical protein
MKRAGGIAGITVTPYQTPYGCASDPRSIDSRRGHEGGEVGSSVPKADGTASSERQHPEDTGDIDGGAPGIARSPGT